MAIPVKYRYSLVRADEIIKEWEPKLIGLRFTIQTGKVITITKLYKLQFGLKYQIMVGTETEYNDELNSLLLGLSKIKFPIPE